MKTGLSVNAKIGKLIVDCVRERGEATVDQVVGTVGRLIPSPQASRAGVKYIGSYSNKRCRPPSQWTVEALVRTGRRYIVRNTLNNAVRRKVLERVRPGVYRVRRSSG
jgi:hypothetical protein